MNDEELARIITKAAEIISEGVVDDPDEAGRHAIVREALEEAHKYMKVELDLILTINKEQ